VKKLVLLSVAALMLASSVFAPVAMAREPGEVTIESVTYRPDSEVNFLVTATIQCTEGTSIYSLGVGLLESAKKPKLDRFDPTRLVVVGDIGLCETTGPQSFTAEVGLHPPTPTTEKGKIWAFALGRVCDFSQPQNTCTAEDLASKQVKIR
jgi:hypothetical protein